MRYFSEIQLLPELPDNHAAIVNVRTGVLRLSDKYWRWMPDVYKKFMLYHELGHLQVGLSEDKAEKWAIEKFIRDGYSARDIVLAHSRVYPWGDLSESDQWGLLKKTARSLELVMHFDFHINGHTKIQLHELYER